MTTAVSSRRRIRGRHLFRVASGVLRAGGRILGFLPRSIVVGLLVALRNLPGYPGLALRYMCVRRLAESCGDNVAIYAGVHLHNLEHCRLGSNVKIGEMCFLGALGGVTIEDDVSLAHGTTVLTEEHDYQQPGPLKETDILLAPVVIGKGSWIGAGVRILSGVRIGDGVAVGAGSVVTHDVPDGGVAAGVPARLLRLRTEEVAE